MVVKKSDDAPDEAKLTPNVSALFWRISKSVDGCRRWKQSNTHASRALVADFEILRIVPFASGL